MTFAELDKEAAAIPVSDAVCEGVNYVIAHADDNGRTDAEKLDSVANILAYLTSPSAAAVREWFATRGVTW